MRLPYMSMQSSYSMTGNVTDQLNFHSYDAAEDNELSFRQGDRIVEIEAASEDWWQGRDRDGNVGLFPGKFQSV